MKCAPSMRIVIAMALAASPLVATAQQFQSNQATPRQSQSRAQAGNRPQAGNPARGQAGSRAQAGARQAPTPQVVATVDGDPITRREIQATLQPQLQGRQLSPQQAQQMQQQILQTLIHSRLVEQYVQENGPEIEDQEVKQSVDQLKQQLQAQQVSYTDFLASRGYSEEMLRQRVKGSLAWQKYQQQQVTEPKLQAYFQENQQQFQADDFGEARDRVASAYVGQLWQDIVAKAQPEAKIQTNAAQPAAGGQPRSRQPRAGQSRAGQSRAGQPRAGQPRAGQPRTGQRRTGQPRSGQ